MQFYHDFFPDILDDSLTLPGISFIKQQQHEWGKTVLPSDFKIKIIVDYPFSI